MHVRSVEPTSWTRIGPSPLDAVVPLKFAVRQQNVEEMLKLADSVATPTSPLYGQVCHWCPCRPHPLLPPSASSAAYSVLERWA